MAYNFWFVYDTHSHSRFCGNRETTWYVTVFLENMGLAVACGLVHIALWPSGHFVV